MGHKIYVEGNPFCLRDMEYKQPHLATELAPALLMALHLAMQKPDTPIGVEVWVNGKSCGTAKITAKAYAFRSYFESPCLQEAVDDFFMAFNASNFSNEPKYCIDGGVCVDASDCFEKLIPHIEVADLESWGDDNKDDGLACEANYTTISGKGN